MAIHVALIIPNIDKSFISLKFHTVCSRSSGQFNIVSYDIKWITTSWVYTVCPGSSDPPGKLLNIFASENEVYTIFWLLRYFR